MKERELRGIAKKLPPILSAVITILLIITYVNRCFLVLSEDVSPPQWRNQKQSALVIPQGGYISLQADGMDNISLSKAMLSTNETGVWKNETEYAALWRQEAVYGFDNFGTATYKDGVLYAPSKGDDNVYAVKASNGDVIWNRTVRECDASPCIDGDVLYVGEAFDPTGEPVPAPKAMALNKTTGEEIWHFTDPGNHSWVGSPLVNGEYVYYTTYFLDINTTIGSGSVYALNKTDGNIIWNQTIGRIVCSVAYDNGMIFVSAFSPYGQYAFNATTGAQIWNKTYGQSWDTSPVIYNGMVIQTVRNGILWTVLVLNETTGELIREFTDKGSTGTPLVHDGRMFIPCNDWRMWAFDLITGEELWHTVELHNGFPQDYCYCSPAAAGGAIYLQSLNGTFYVINETDGSILWSFTMGGLGFGSPSIGDDCVFITNDFALYAFKIGPGSGDWPMFCQNNLHQSYSEHGIEYVRWPLTQPKDFKDSSSTWLTSQFIWCNETITSAAIAWKIYFFNGAGNTNVTDVKIFYVGMSIHNIAIINVVPQETTIEQNQTTSINITVVNEGNNAETFNLTLYYDSTKIDFQTVTLNTSELKVLTFQWNTTGVPYGSYTLSANASEVPEEVNIQDNIYVVEYSVTIIPEFPATITLLAAFSILTLIAAILVRKKKLASETSCFH